MTLDEWMCRRRVENRDFAALLEPLVGRKVHFYTVTRWRQFSCTPPRDVILAIAHLTDFAVRAKDWYPEVARAHAAARQARKPQAESGAVSS